MINTTLPVFETELNEKSGELIHKTRDIKCKIDVSLFAEKRWEENFPANAKNETPSMPGLWYKERRASLCWN